MFLNLEPFKPPIESAWRASLLVPLTAAVLAGCGLNPAARRAEEAAATAKLAEAAQAERVRSSQAAPASNRPQSGEAVAQMLAYADRARLMTPPEMAQELLRFGDSPADPVDQLQLSLILSQVRQLPELIRAQELLARVLGNSEAQPLHPLARLLAARYAEQRRVEEQLEKQNQQLRDVQRKLDQTNERLEALKAIERSLANRPSPPAPPTSSAPASSNHIRPAPAP